MVWVCYSSSSTCLAFVAALLRLLLFAVLCHLLLWGHKTTPKGVVLTRGGGFIPQKGFIPFKSGHETTRGGFKGGFMPHLGVVLCPGPSASLSLVCMTPVQCRVPPMGATTVTVTATATSENGSNHWPLTRSHPNTPILLTLLPYAPKWGPTWKPLLPLVNPQSHLVKSMHSAPP